MSNPDIGRKTDIPNVRIKIIRNYLIFYEIKGDSLHILSFWDNRQDPQKIKF